MKIAVIFEWFNIKYIKMIIPPQPPKGGAERKNVQLYCSKVPFRGFRGKKEAALLRQPPENDQILIAQYPIHRFLIIYTIEI